MATQRKPKNIGEPHIFGDQASRMSLRGLENVLITAAPESQITNVQYFEVSGPESRREGPGHILIY